MSVGASENKLETNVKAHVEQVRSSCQKEVATVKKAANQIRGLKPAQAVLTLVGDSVENLSDGLSGQATIVRRWV